MLLQTGATNKTEPNCFELNNQAWAAAVAALNATWPRALERNAIQGGGFILLKDTFAKAGPLWVLGSLDFQAPSSGENATTTGAQVQSLALVTGLGAFIYPGSHYCKLLAPSRAVEWLQTQSLRRRYTLGSLRKKYTS